MPVCNVVNQSSINITFNKMTAHDEELGCHTPDNASPVVCRIPLKQIWYVASLPPKRPPIVHDSLVTLALQNSLLALVMHYSRVSTPPALAYSAGTAVLLSEIFKGLISLSVAFSRIDASGTPPDGTRLRRLAKDVFSPDCWKLSIPAILYG